MSNCRGFPHERLHQQVKFIFVQVLTLVNIFLLLTEHPVYGKYYVLQLKTNLLNTKTQGCTTFLRGRHQPSKAYP
ncbi:MAG: hypothetical protein F6K10_30780 [Moorea sp. SIO2B7]|nr:hypothetical protein [Moorena sp. SIO2B7]